MAAKLILLGGDHPVEHILSSFNTLGRHPDNSIQVLDRIVSKEDSRITLGPDGRYRPPRRPKGGACAQHALLAELAIDEGGTR